MVHPVVRLIVCVALAAATTSAAAQVTRKIDIRKLTTDEVRRFERQARRGETRAMTIVGIAYASGKGVPRDAKMAVKWLMKSSRNDEIAQAYLGQMYMEGEGVPQDAVRARAWYSKAASLGDVNAQFNYASLCFNGEGGPQDLDTAAKYFEIAAREGHAPSQQMIGRMYQFGNGVAKDPEQAQHWYEAAARQDYSPALFTIGISYLDGSLGKHDPVLGISYLERGVGRGDWTAALRLANLYLTGGDVPQSETEAYKWFAIARELSGGESTPTTETLATKLNPAELTVASQEISEWKAVHFPGK